MRLSMINAIILIALLTPGASGNLSAALADGDGDEASGLCTQTASISRGQTASCTGILWTIPQTRLALSCAGADLPKCKNDLQLARALSSTQLDACTAKLANSAALITAYRGLLDAATPLTHTLPWYRSAPFIAVLSAAAFAGGVYTGVVVF